MDTFALKCLKVPDGLMFLVPERNDGRRKINAAAVQVSVNEVGVFIRAEDIMLPIFDELLVHFVKNPNVQIWFVGEIRFVEENAITLELDRDAILEAKGVWEYKKAGMFNV